MLHLGITAIVNFSDWDDPDYPETGGINSVIKNLLPHIRADKIMLYGITYDRKNLLKEKKVTDQLSVFPLFYAPAVSVIPKRVWALLFGWRLKKYLKKHSIDVVYNHAEEMALWIPHSVPYIHHLHTYVNVLDVSGKRLARVKAFKKWWEKLRTYTMRRSAKIIAVNKDIIDMGAQIVGSDRIIAFPNYVDTNAFSYTDASVLRQKLNLQNKSIALFIGRISYVKGLELFVDTVNALNAQGQESWAGLIVGNGDYQPTLQAYIDQANAHDQFIFVGPVNTATALSQYYSLANVFLITSLSESVPLTLLESLSCGTPVVSTDVGIAADVLDQSNGFVVGREAQAFMKKVQASVSLKKTTSLIKDPHAYSVEYASTLLNQEFKHYNKVSRQ